MEENKKSTKQFLIIYCIAIFVFAVSLILIASFSQLRITREADAIAEKLSNAESIAADSKTRLDAVMTENSRLNERIKNLTEENEKLTEQANTDAKRIAAYQKLSEMVNLKRLGRVRALSEAIASFEEGEYVACLNVADREIYNSIK